MSCYGLCISLELHLGGFFEWRDKIEYLGGWVERLPNIDPDLMSYFELDSMHSELYSFKTGKEGSVVARYWWLNPTAHSLEKGLKVIDTDAELMQCLGQRIPGKPVIIFADLLADGPLSVVTPDKVRAEDENPKDIVGNVVRQLTWHDSEGHVEGTENLDENVGTEQADEGDNDSVCSDVPSWVDDNPDEGNDDVFVEEIDDADSVDRQNTTGDAENAENVENADSDAEFDPSLFSDVDSVESVDSLDESSDEDDISGKPKHKWFDDKELDDPKLVLGLMFKSPQQFREALKVWNLRGGYDIDFVKNENRYITAVCKFAHPDKKPKRKNVSRVPLEVDDTTSFCPWRIHASPFPGVGFQIKTFNNNHICGRSYKNHLADSRYIAKLYLDRFRDNPKWDIASVQKTLQRERMLQVSKWTVMRAKRKAVATILGDYEEQFRNIRDYAMTIMHTNPGSSVRIATESTGVDDEYRFKRIYMCLGAMKKGFLAGCRPIIGLDGCHIKTRFGGILLSAVGRDGNDNIFLIAVAAVESENKESWGWFLDLLMADIGGFEEKGWVFISDRQKGLCQVFNERWPTIEHRFCVRHLYDNFKKAFGGEEKLKKLFWKAACTGNKREWACFMKEIDKHNPRIGGKPNAFDWLSKIPAEQWARSHFSTKAVCAVLVNNLSESFNAYIREARDKPITSMLECIRRKFMDRIQVKRKGMERYEGEITPHIWKKIEKTKVFARNCFPIFSGDDKWEVQEFGQLYEVDVRNQMCTCRMWELSGIPCKHAISCLQVDRAQFSHHVSKFYQKEAYLAAYNYSISPVPSPPNWIDSGLPSLLPPIVRVPIGRPRKERKRAVDEPRKIKSRSSKTGVRMTCRKCFQHGHNARTCKNEMHSGSIYNKNKASTSHGQGASTSRPSIQSQTAASHQSIQGVRAEVNLSQSPSFGGGEYSSQASGSNTQSQATKGKGKGISIGSACAKATARSHGQGDAIAKACAKGKRHINATATATSTDIGTATATAIARDTLSSAKRQRGGRPTAEGLDGDKLWDRYI